MSTEESLIEVRRAKHVEANGGTYPLAKMGTDISETLMQFERYADEPTLIPVTINPNEFEGFTEIVHGRITNFRKSGALTFIKVTDSTGSIQLIASKMFLPSYADLRLLDLGDIVEVEGKLALSKTNEKSILITSWRILTKSHRSPPEKFVGLQNTETKYRQRYLDLMSSEESRARFTVRTYIIRAIRDFMDSTGFLEVETSTLGTIASGANAKPFTTHHNALDIDLRLRIAPELNLKRLLVGGLDRVYEIGRAYRNEGIDTKHNPEFTMMETYQAYGVFPDLIVQTAAMLHHIQDYCRIHLPDNIKPFYQKWQDEKSFSFSHCVEVTMLNAVVSALPKAGLELHSSEEAFGRTPSGEVPHISSVEVFAPHNERLQKIDVKGMFHTLSQCTSDGEQIAVLFEYVAEPFLTEDYRSDDGKYSKPVFITEYPKEICPLARANDTNPTVCDRFELFVEGRELANAFQELNDPDEQALRFREQLEGNDKDPMAFDSDYVEALEHGMPPAIGFGMGIDRLCMLLTGTTTIKDVILFPTLRPTK
jgi:lysyl-tRNA synthetase, class II